MTVGAAAFLSFGSPQLNLGWVYDNYLPLMTASVLLSSALAVLVYVGSFGGRLLAEGGHTGYAALLITALDPDAYKLQKRSCVVWYGMVSSRLRTNSVNRAFYGSHVKLCTPP